MNSPSDTKPRWERRKDARPQELLAAALDLFVDKGYAATRLDDVAARAGVSKGTLYLYFTNKEELFKAVVRENLLPALGEAEAAIEECDGPSAELFRGIMLGWWERIGDTKLSGICKLMIAESGNFPELARFYHEEVISRGNKMIISLLRARHRARRVPRGRYPATVEGAGRADPDADDLEAFVLRLPGHGDLGAGISGQLSRSVPARLAAGTRPPYRQRHLRLELSC